MNQRYKILTVKIYFRVCLLHLFYMNIFYLYFCSSYPLCTTNGQRPKPFIKRLHMIGPLNNKISHSRTFFVRSQSLFTSNKKPKKKLLNKKVFFL